MRSQVECACRRNMRRCLQYLAPETLGGKAKPTYSADLWALGCLMGEMLLPKGTWPFGLAKIQSDGHNQADIKEQQQGMEHAHAHYASAYSGSLLQLQADIDAQVCLNNRTHVKST